MILHTEDGYEFEVNASQIAEVCGQPDGAIIKDYYGESLKVREMGFIVISELGRELFT